MAKKILLIDHDSQIPNVALMKLSSFHKKIGNEVFLNYCCGKADFAYISKIFRASKRITYRNPCEVGGTGNRDITKKLPEEVECSFPDYDLYGTSVAHGFTSRGCPNNCAFCYVPKKEGKWRAVGDLYDLWKPGMLAVKIFDNNILYDKDHFMKISAQIIHEKLMWDFIQGSDIRSVDRDRAIRIGELVKSTPGRMYRFSWDNPNQKDVVLSGIDLLLEYVESSHLFCYVLIGFNTTYDEDLMRVSELFKRGIRVFPMVFDRKRYSLKYDTELLMLFGRWCRHKTSLSGTFEEYLIAAGHPHMVKYIGQELHAHKINGPREDGIARRPGRGFFRKKWIHATNTFGGVY